MGIYNEQVKNLKGIPVYVQAVQDGEIKEIPITIKDVFLAVLNDYRPTNLSDLTICVTATRKIQKDDENLEEDELRKLVDLILSSTGLAMYTIIYTLDKISEYYPAVSGYINEKLSKKIEKAEKPQRKKSSKKKS